MWLTSRVLAQAICFSLQIGQMKLLLVFTVAQRKTKIKTIELKKSRIRSITGD